MEALAVEPGRPRCDARDKWSAELERQVARLEGELGKARSAIEVQGKLCALPDQFATGSAGVPRPTFTTDALNWSRPTGPRS